MRGWIPLACAATVALAGCAREPVPDGATLLGRSHRAETTLCYTTHEVNEQVITGAWPRCAGAARGDDLMYGRPVVTEVRRSQCGPRQKRFEILATNAPGAPMAGTVTVQDGTRGWRFVPVDRRIDLLTFPNTEMDPLNWLALVLSNYDITDIHRDQVAGAPAWYMEMRPRHTDRPMKRQWLDAETYLPLRQELWGPDGSLLSATQVVERPRTMSPARMQSPALPVREGMGSVRVTQGDQDWMMPPEELRSVLGYPLGHLGELPTGFQLVGTYLYYCPHTPHPLGLCARWELTDGVATISVIQTRAGVGALNSIDTPQDLQGPIETAAQGPYHFIVRGNLPAPELRRIAEHITLDHDAETHAPQAATARR